MNLLSRISYFRWSLYVSIPTSLTLDTVSDRPRTSLEMDGTLNFNCYSLGGQFRPNNLNKFYTYSINLYKNFRNYLSRHIKSKSMVNGKFPKRPKSVICQKWSSLSMSMTIRVANVVADHNDLLTQ